MGMGAPAQFWPKRKTTFLYTEMILSFKWFYKIFCDQKTLINFQNNIFILIFDWKKSKVIQGRQNKIHFFWIHFKIAFILR